MFILSIDVGWKNLSYCVLEMEGEKVEIKEWNLKNLLEEDANVNALSVEKLIDACAKKISEFILESKQTLLKLANGDLEKCKVFVEAQPMGPFSKNLKTKILSHIFQYSFGQEIRVLFINSKNKLKKVLKGDKLTYPQLKKLSIEHTLELLKTKYADEKWYTFFNMKKGKRDDLADCFLQAIYGNF
jgi:hypothetical protein